MFLLTWLGLDCHNIKRLRHDIRNVFNGRLRRGERVCGRGSTARHVQLQCGVLIIIDHYHCVCGCHGHVLDDGVWRGKRLFRRICAASLVHVQCWILFFLEYFGWLHRHEWHLQCVRRRLRMFGWLVANTDTMFV